jgi:hypothetical protein
VLFVKESSTYQAILEEGRIEGAITKAKKLLRLWGDDAFGPPDARTGAAIERIDDLTHLEDLHKRMWSASSWRDVFYPPSRRGRNKRRPSS